VELILATIPDLEEAESEIAAKDEVPSGNKTGSSSNVRKKNRGGEDTTMFGSQIEQVSKP
jgi:hypothetical protein